MNPVVMKTGGSGAPPTTYDVENPENTSVESQEKVLEKEEKEVKQTFCEQYKVIIMAIIIVLIFIALGFGINYVVEQKSPVLSNS